MTVTFDKYIQKRTWEIRTTITEIHNKLILISLNNNDPDSIAQQEKRNQTKRIGMPFFSSLYIFFNHGLLSPTTLSVCHWAIGLRGDASISDQWRASVPDAFQPNATFPIGSDDPIRS
jgi:hypothetical protein